MKKSSTIIMIAIFFGFLSCGENNHLDTTKSFQDFTDPYFGQTPPGDKTEKLTWEISKRESEDHISVPLKSLFDGLEFIFSDCRSTNKKIKQGFQLVKEHYFILSKKYNFEVRPSEATINAIGYWYLRNEDSENAIESFKFNTNQFPSSANVYDSLGDALERIGHNVEAAENYKTAVKFGGLVNDPNLKIYKENLRRVEELK